MKPATREDILAAYSEKVAADLEAMSDEDAIAAAQEAVHGDGLAKLADDQEALGRFIHIGWKGGVEDFDEFLKEAEGDFDRAVELFEEDLAKMASEVSAAEEQAEKLASEGEEEITAQDFAVQAAMEADPDRFLKVAAEVLKEQDITLYETDADGNPVSELQLA